MTLAIAHLERSVAVLDMVVERRPPFNPESVVDEFVSVLRRYGVAAVEGDRYGGEWCRQPFRSRGVAYELAPKPKSDLYRDFLPLVTSGKVELLDHPRLLAQLATLERRTGRGGRDSIDHPPGGHDDLANAATLALVSQGCGVAQTPGFPILVGARPGRGWCRSWSHSGSTSD